MQRQKPTFWSMHPGCDMKIYTLTLNPAYDVHAYAAQFVPFHENLAQIRSKEAGGKGLNISRGLRAAGVANTAVIVLGKENGADYKEYLSQTGMDFLLFENEGRIRENLTLHCDDAPETRISFSGFQLEEAMLKKILEQLQLDDRTVITFTGRVPDGIGMDSVKAFLRRLQAMGAKIVVDSRSFALEDLYDVQPWLIKPNQEEISAFFGCAVETVRDAAGKAMEIAAKGIPNVMISLGQQGALLAADGVVRHAQPPQLQAVSTVGAGDSAIAGFIAAAIEGSTAEDCLRRAVAFGTAACQSEGSQPPCMQTVAALLDQIKITEVE